MTFPVFKNFEIGDVVYFKFGYRTKPLSISAYRKNEFTLAIVLNIDKNIEVATLFVFSEQKIRRTSFSSLEKYKKNKW